MLWTDKYAPKNIDEIVGNPEAREKMKVWALDWNRGERKPPLLLFGPTGVGKTCSAHAIAKTYGWELLEMNASDSMDKKSVEGALSIASSTSSLSGALKIIVVDEIDGVAERGGISAVYEVVKAARQPMIIIANDAWGQTMAPLRTACVAVEMRRVNVRSVASKLKEIAHAEALDNPEEMIETIAENSKGDLRSAITDLQALAGAKDADTVERDRERNVFDSVRKVFKGKTYWEAKEALIGLDVEPEMFARWIDENVPKEYDAPEDIARAFDSLSRADVFYGRIRNRQYWGFLRYFNDLTTAGVALAKKEPYHRFVKYDFPQVIKKLSASKSRRAREKKVLGKIGDRTHASTRRARSFLPVAKLMMKENAGETAAYFRFDEEDLAYFGIGKGKEKKAETKTKRRKKE
jgi:replication factor C large subunit